MTFCEDCKERHADPVSASPEVACPQHGGLKQARAHWPVFFSGRLLTNVGGAQKTSRLPNRAVRRLRGMHSLICAEMADWIEENGLS